MRAEPLETGSVIANAYRLERVLGQGGMGVVWAARDIRTNRSVALKFLREGRAADMRNQERFLREARAAMAVMHPAIARVEAVLETNAGVPFLVMELLEGEPLRVLLMRRGTLTPFEVARLLLPVVDAVLAAHAIGIVHRDLKPENVFLLHGSGAVRVLDFGIAKQLPRAGETGAPSLTSTGGILGTPIYMAPEQIFGDADLGPAADVWSLGITIYELLTGRAPTEGEGFGPVIRRITTDPIQPLEQLRPDAPRRLTGLVDRMLIRDRNRRAPLVEVRAVLAGLADAGENAPRSIRTAETMPPIAPHYPPMGGTTTGGASLRHPPARARKESGAVIAIAIVGVLVLLGGGGAGAWYLVNRAPGTPVTTAGAAVQDAQQLQLDAVKMLQNRDGKTCLAKLDDYDRRYAAVGAGLPSTNAKASMAGIRAQCMMLVGKCQEGKKLYATWIPQYTPVTQVVKEQDFRLTTEFTLVDHCEGPDLTPEEAFLRANHRLYGQAGSVAKPPSAAECQALFTEEQRLRAQIGPAAVARMSPFAVTDPLGECIARSKTK